MTYKNRFALIPTFPDRAIKSVSLLIFVYSDIITLSRQFEVLLRYGRTPDHLRMSLFSNEQNGAYFGSIIQYMTISHLSAWFNTTTESPQFFILFLSLSLDLVSLFYLATQWTFRYSSMIGGKFGARIGRSRILISSNAICCDTINVVAQPNDLFHFDDWILTAFNLTRQLLSLICLSFRPLLIWKCEKIEINMF